MQATRAIQIMSAKKPKMQKDAEISTKEQKNFAQLMG